MNRLLPFVIFTAILLQTSVAQTTFKISSYNETPEAFKYLLLSNTEIAANDTINEKILDLVEPMLVDSVIEKRKQFHRVFLVGPLIHAFGNFNWRAVDMKKQKFVGTVKEHGRSGSFEFTEWDIKFHMQFHLQKYLYKELQAYELQRKYHRQDIRPSHRKNYKVYPFVHDSVNINSKDFDLGTELTPPPAFIPQLNYLFFPTLPGAGGLKDHPNFETEHPSMGFYGVTCLDCNHSCHSEMHPYEMVWWLKAAEDDERFSKTWLLGLFHEGSNRFKNWSRNPMNGSFKIPFAFEVDSEMYNLYDIKVEHLVFNQFIRDELKKMSPPENSFSPMEDYYAVIEGTDHDVEINVLFPNPINTNGLRYWFNDLNYDRQNHIVSGYFNFATSAQDLYTTRVTFGSNYE